jgi:flavodoxin
MKKSIKNLCCLVLMMALTFTLTACGSTQNSDPAPSGNGGQQNAPASGPAADVPETPADQPDTSPDSTGADDTRTLVVYFSRTGEQYTVGVIDHGNTAIVAEMIAEATGADLFEVLPVDDHYPMTYSELTDVAKREQNEKARPAYAGDVPDLSDYDTIFIGAPVWWGDWPMIMYTFFEENEDALSGKTLIPFSTHEGSGLSGFDRKLSSSCPGSTVLDGLAVRGNDCQNKQDSVRTAVNEWIAGLGY